MENRITSAIYKYFMNVCYDCNKGKNHIHVVVVSILASSNIEDSNCRASLWREISTILCNGAIFGTSHIIDSNIASVSNSTTNILDKNVHYSKTFCNYVNCEFNLILHINVHYFFYLFHYG